jgi:hypothetical protein
MLKQEVCVTPIRRDIHASAIDRRVADFAYSLWLTSAFRGDSPEEALATAMHVMKEKESTGIHLVRKRSSVPHAIHLLVRRPLK